MAAAMIIVGITTWIETVIETIVAEAIIIEDVMMTERRHWGMFQGKEPVNRLDDVIIS